MMNKVGSPTALSISPTTVRGGVLAVSIALALVVVMHAHNTMVYI